MDIQYSTEIRKIVDQKQSGGVFTLNDFPRGVAEKYDHADFEANC